MSIINNNNKINLYLNKIKTIKLECIIKQLIFLQLNLQETKNDD